MYANDPAKSCAPFLITIYAQVYYIAKSPILFAIFCSSKENRRFCGQGK